MALFRRIQSHSRMADGVARVGFRKWYERELLSSHGYMVLAIMSVIALFGSMEIFGRGTSQDKVTSVVSVLVCAAVTFAALRRYFFLMMRAETMANQANCAACGEYGRFTIVQDDRTSTQTEVCCRKCAHHWTISDID